MERNSESTFLSAAEAISTIVYAICPLDPLARLSILIASAEKAEVICVSIFGTFLCKIHTRANEVCGKETAGKFTLLEILPQIR